MNTDKMVPTYEVRRSKEYPFTAREVWEIYPNGNDFRVCVVDTNGAGDDCHDLYANVIKCAFEFAEHTDSWNEFTKRKGN